jgi:hypothetical protein
MCCANNAMASDAASVAMCPASESSASDPAHQAPAASITAKPAVSISATASACRAAPPLSRRVIVCVVVPGMVVMMGHGAARELSAKTRHERQPQVTSA